MINQALKSLVAGGTIVLAMLACSTAAQAQELKIGYVNSERVLKEAAPAKAAQLKTVEAQLADCRGEMTECADELAARARRKSRHGTLHQVYVGRRT